MTDIIAKAEAALVGVTEGWHEAHDENDCVFNSDGLPVAFYVAPKDRAFIAAARQLVPDLIAHARAQEAEIARLREALQWQADQPEAAPFMAMRARADLEATP